MPDPVLSARSRVANLHRSRSATPEQLADARRQLTVANCEAAIRKALDAVPAPTIDERKQLAVLLITEASK